MNRSDTLRILSNDEVEKITGLRQKQRRKMEKVGEFPLRVPLSSRLSGYLESEINEWLEQRIADRAALLAIRPSPNPLAKSNRVGLKKASK